MSNKWKRFSQVPRVSNARYLGKRSKMEIEIYKQQIEIVRRGRESVTRVSGRKSGHGKFLYVYQKELKRPIHFR